MTNEAEERREERVRSLLRARILFNNGNSTVDCTVRNLSSGGARIAVQHTVGLPDSFDLEIPQKNKIYRALLRWRDLDAIGVEFCSDDSASQAAGRLTRAQQLEEENRKLKQRVARLTQRLSDLGQDVQPD